MARTSDASARIAHLVGIPGYDRRTPDTLTARYTFNADLKLHCYAVYSYSMLIATFHKPIDGRGHDGRSAWVTDEHSSMTTNRHIKAARHVANVWFS